MSEGGSVVNTNIGAAGHPGEPVVENLQEQGSAVQEGYAQPKVGIELKPVEVRSENYIRFNEFATGAQITQGQQDVTAKIASPETRIIKERPTKLSTDSRSTEIWRVTLAASVEERE